MRYDASRRHHHPHDRRHCLKEGIEETVFVRAKRLKRGNKQYISYVVVENYRRDGKVRQRTIYTLGKHRTIVEAIEARRARLKDLQSLSSEFPAIARAAAGHLEADIARLEELNRNLSKDWTNTHYRKTQGRTSAAQSQNVADRKSLTS